MRALPAGLTLPMWSSDSTADSTKRPQAHPDTFTDTADHMAATVGFPKRLDRPKQWNETTEMSLNCTGKERKTEEEKKKTSLAHMCKAKEKCTDKGNGKLE